MTPRDYANCLALAILLLVSCSPTRHISDKDHLLVDVELEGLKNIPEESIEALYRQQPNIKIPLLNFYPQLEVYYFGKMFYRPDKIQQRIEKQQARFKEKIEKAGDDSIKINRLVEQRNNRVERLQTTLKNGNFFMRKVGEPPSIYDSTLTKKTVEQIDIFLNSKGYFQNQTTYSETFKKQRAHVTYKITEGQPYVYDKVELNIADPAIKNLVISNSAESYIQQGKIYDESQISAELDRLTLLMRNNGYYYFNKRFIYFEVDTSFGGNTVRPVTIIENPTDTTLHQSYTLRNIYFVEDASANRFGISRDTVIYNNIHFLSYNHQFRPKALSRKVRLAPGQVYSYNRTLFTQRQLTDLGMFRYSNVTYNPVPDSGVHELNGFITSHPTDRFQLSNQLGISLREQLPGPFLNLRLLMRNVTGGAELLEFGIRAGLEGVMSRTSDERRGEYSQELGGNIALSVPRFVSPISSYDFFARNAPRTRFNIGYTYINRPDYERTNAEFSMQYHWRNRNYQQFIFSPFEINILNTPRINPDFRDYLEGISQTFLRSFQSNFVSAMNFAYLYNDNDLAQTKRAHYFRGFVEMGGLLKFLTEDLFLTDLNRFQYVKLEADYRRYLPQAPERMFAYRVHGGVAHPFGSVKAVPYEEYFFAGGGSSIRAWRPRRLGPGSYNPKSGLDEEQLARVDKIDPERPGEVVIEGSAEYRFPVFGFIKGALFVDAGNVWSLSPDITSEREGSEFSRQFYKELGVGTGIGIRFDFTFLIVRFDIGTRVYDPMYERNTNERKGYVLNKFSFNRDQTTVNFGIGYPF